ncbi:uncharacterized protein LOC144452765 [Glandiceps talaboti]
MGCASSKSARTAQRRDTNTVEKVIFGRQDKSIGYTKPQIPLIIDPRTHQYDSQTNPFSLLPNELEELEGNTSHPVVKRENILEGARKLVKEINPSADINERSVIEISKTLNEDEFEARLSNAARRKRPRRPVSLEVISGSCAELTIEWTVNSRRKNRHEIYCTSDGDEKHLVGNTVEGINTYMITGLKPATEYQIEVIGVNCEDGVILRSEPATMRTETGAYFHAGLRPREITDKSVSIKWDPAIGKFDNYSIVHHGPDGEEIEDAFVGPETRTCKIEGLKPNVKYLIIVRVVCCDSLVSGDEASIEVVTDGKYQDRRALRDYIQSVVDTEGIAFNLEIDRKKPLLQQCKDHYAAVNNQKLRSRPEIEFKDNKKTCDIGGPRREFFTLLMQNILTGYQTDEDDDSDIMLLLEGADDHKVFVHDEVFLGKEIFALAGKMVQHSILWGGPGLVGLAQSVKDYIRTGSLYEVVLEIEDVPDLEIREIIQSVIDCRGTELKSIGEKPETASMLSDAGIVDRSITESNKQIYVQELLLHNIVRKRQREMDQFRKGFDSLSLAKFLMQNPGTTVIMFPRLQDSLVTFHEISQLIKYEKRDSKAKKNTSQYFMKYLQTCDNRRKTTDVAMETCISLSRVLSFITGCPMIPPKTYGKIIVSFHNQPFPIANTCFQEIHLPLDCENYTKFQECMDYAISNSDGFGLV